MDLGQWKEAKFIERPNRFLARVELQNGIVEAHVPDPGRLEELLLPGKRIRLRAAKAGPRRTSWDVIGVECPAGWVNIDSRLPNLLFGEELREGHLEEFPNVRKVVPEYRFGASVLDFYLEAREGPCLIEVKGCTLVEDGRALFPDAPTARGTRHLRELARAIDVGWRSCLVIVVKREDALLFAPNTHTDPVFSSTLREVHNLGVEIIPYLAPWRENHMEIEGRLPVRL